MSESVTDIAILRQHLLTDQLLGLRFVPIPAAASEPRPRSTARASVAPTPTPTRPRSDAESSGNAERLRALDETQVRSCRKCILCEGRTQTVFGQGNPSARIVFVGEGPGYEEDKQGLAFVGPAGQLLTRMIEAMGLRRDDVYICNVVKCRPPGNRTPSADEMLACSPYLREQLDIIRPEMIVALGAPAAKTLLNSAETIGRLRGRFHDYYFSGTTGEGPSVPLMPTYHPAYLLRSPDEKAKTWSDLQQVMAAMGLRRPER